MDISDNKFKKNLKRIIDWTAVHHEPVFITSKNNVRKVALLSYEDYCSLEETAYLLKSSKNAQRLLKAISES